MKDPLEIIEIARDLSGPGSHNPEYDRALVELAAAILGLSNAYADAPDQITALILGKTPGKDRDGTSPKPEALPEGEERRSYASELADHLLRMWGDRSVKLYAAQGKHDRIIRLIRHGVPRGEIAGIVDGILIRKAVGWGPS